MLPGNAATSGNAFIDDNHSALLDHIDRICVSIRDGGSTSGFRPHFRNFITDIESHFSHEEVILNGAGFENIDQHTIKHREVSYFLRTESFDLHSYDDAVAFLASARIRIFKHELLEDQEYWSLFEPMNNNVDDLIVWTAEFETGNSEVDKQHKALANYISRLDRRLTAEPSAEIARKELQAIQNFSQVHFSEEEVKLGLRLHAGHKANHEYLIRDLAALTDEIQKGRQEVKHVGEYLKYWLLNHIRTFDIPEFLNGPS